MLITFGFHHISMYVAYIFFLDNKRKWEHRCAGSLLTKNHVLTAARCFDYFGPDHDQSGEKAYVMRFGTTNILDEGEETINRGIDEFKVHPKYEKGKPYFDVGLAITFVEIDFTAYIRPICLPTESSDDADFGERDSVTLSGWGKIYDPTGRNFNMTKKIQLSEARVSTITNNKVQNHLSNRIFTDFA